MSPLREAAVIALLGGGLGLDRVAALQSMASRPLVAASLAGWCLGRLELGLVCGVLLEFVWLMELPVGASVPPDETLAALLAVSFAGAAPAGWALAARACFGVLAALPFGYLGRLSDVAVRAANRRLWERAKEGASRGRGPTGAHLGGLVLFFGAGAVAAALGVGVGAAAVGALAGQLPGRAGAVFEGLAGALPLFGCAAVFAGLGPRRFQWLLTAGFWATLASRAVLVRAGVTWPG